MTLSLLTETPAGLYCPAGDFYIDPWQPVARAVITHAHGDHAHFGHEHYLTATDGEFVLRSRMGPAVHIDTLPYGESLTHGGVRVSLHPAGHVLGSAQVRLEKDGEVVVVSGDYKVAADPTCKPLEVVRCHSFITESTFGLPIYRWPTYQVLVDSFNDWWRISRDEGRAALVFAYSLGKAQRVLAGLDPSIGPIYCHGAVEKMNAAYRFSGIELPETKYAGGGERGKDWAGALIIAPPSAAGTPWQRKFGDVATAFVSGWMAVRGARRRRAVDRGFVLSDHADWPGLCNTIAATGAERVFVTHGQVPVMVRWLREQGLDAQSLRTEFEGEQDGRDDALEEPAETPTNQHSTEAEG
ncbi:ligase-associated DNA damage response exonuclease [Anatilimnocola floriformis]|uniref:ligase-associated DNA damage response exonuclease n=1 Tax=Anatilimnocola floriformis TaxID=2948575 RepID=UPI0020C2719A|nr:ligase-associated DNA damage response exonuclease [Anatilimnocola floriformis]